MDSKTLNIKKIKQGKAERYSFSKIDVPYEMPDLLSIQKDSYKVFLEEDIGDILNEFNPIIDYSNKAELSFLGYTIDRTPKYSWAECKRRQTSKCSSSSERDWSNHGPGSFHGRYSIYVK